MFCVVDDDGLCDFAAANPWRQRKSEPTPTATPSPTPSATPHLRLWFQRTGFTLSNQNTNSIVRFDNALTATGNIAPSATVSGTATTLDGPQYLAFDPVHDRLFVANVGTATNLGTVLIFDSASTLTGNAAPTRTIGGTVSGLVSPSDVAYDATHDALYVLDATDVLVYNTISSSTKTGDIAPDRTINTSFLTLTAICLDVINDRLYVADSGSNAIGIYDNVSSLTGVVPASRTVGGALTKLASPFGVALDPSKNLVVSNAGGAGSITVYTAASVATGTSLLNVAPVATITGAATTLATPAQIILNPLSTAAK